MKNKKTPKNSAKESTTKRSPKRAAQQQTIHKIAASMSAMLAQMKTEGPRPQMLQRTLAPAGVGPAPAESAVHVFIRCRAGASADTVPGLELEGRGEVRTVLVPMSRIAELAASPDILRISAPRELRPLMDVARPLVRVPQFRKTTKTSGKGVIIGIVDSGLDISHPAFAGRILSLWDQTVSGPGPGGSFVKLGTVLTGTAMVASLDTNGHGTHVAGIAAGAVAPFEGVAPEAELIIVKTNFQNTGIAEGVRWIFSEAARLGRPAVVNLSLGGHGDGHDGTDDLSTVIDDESGPGRHLVAGSAAPLRPTGRVPRLAAFAGQCRP